MRCCGPVSRPGTDEQSRSSSPLRTGAWKCWSWIAAERNGPTRLEELLHTESEWRFDLARGGLFRAVLVRMDEEEHVLMVSMHHIISDGWSEGVLYRELGCLYAAFAREEPSPLPVLPIQYADYAVWQRAWLEGAVLESHLEYWREELRGMQPLELATDRPRPTRPSRRGGSHRFELSESSTRTLKRLSSESGATLFMTLFRMRGDVSLSLFQAGRHHRRVAYRQSKSGRDRGADRVFREHVAAPHNSGGRH